MRRHLSPWQIIFLFSPGAMCVARNSMRKLCTEGMSRKPPMGKKEEQSKIWNVLVNTVGGNSPSSESTEDT